MALLCDPGEVQGLFCQVLPLQLVGDRSSTPTLSLRWRCRGHLSQSMQWQMKDWAKSPTLMFLDQFICAPVNVVNSTVLPR